VFLTLLVWVYMYVRRISFFTRNKVNPRDLAVPGALGQLSPPEVANPSDNLKNLFEIPVIFYALALYLFVTSQGRRRVPDRRMDLRCFSRPSQRCPLHSQRRNAAVLPLPHLYTGRVVHCRSCSAPLSRFLGTVMEEMRLPPNVGGPLGRSAEGPGPR
jgi:MAPEG family